MSYRPTWELQDELADQRRSRRIGDRLLLLEHFPVYTIGRGGDEANLLATPERLREIGAELVRIDRGGDITFHGPGPDRRVPDRRAPRPAGPAALRSITRGRRHRHRRRIRRDGRPARRQPGHLGDGELKLAAIGVRVKRGVTTHGLALNVNNDLRWFDEMIPCGIPTRSVTSLALELGAPAPTDGSTTSWPASWPRNLGLRLTAGADGVIGPAGGREQ